MKEGEEDEEVDCRKKGEGKTRTNRLNTGNTWQTREFSVSFLLIRFAGEKRQERRRRKRGREGEKRRRVERRQRERKTEGA